MKFTFTDKKVNLPKSVHNYAGEKRWESWTGSSAARRRHLWCSAEKRP